MGNLNKAMIIGRLTADPTIKALQNGTTVANFSVATNREWKDREGVEHKEVDFHNIVCFGKLAEIIEKWCTKGMQIYVEGSLRTSSWEDKESGKKMYRTEIQMDNMQMLGSKKDNESPRAATMDLDEAIDRMPSSSISDSKV